MIVCTIGVILGRSAHYSHQGHLRHFVTSFKLYMLIAHIECCSFKAILVDIILESVWRHKHQKRNMVSESVWHHKHDKRDLNLHLLRSVSSNWFALFMIVTFIGTVKYTVCVVTLVCVLRRDDRHFETVTIFMMAFFSSEIISLVLELCIIIMSTRLHVHAWYRGLRIVWRSFKNPNENVAFIHFYWQLSEHFTILLGVTDHQQLTTISALGDRWSWPSAHPQFWECYPGSVFVSSVCCIEFSCEF